MSVVKEFKQFVMRGNVVDLAVGIIIGAAFGKIVSSLVEDVLMPPLGLLLGEKEFTDYKWILQEQACVNGKNMQEVAIKYGNFIQTLFDFLLMAIAIFLLIKGINTLKRKQAAEPVAVIPSAEEKLLIEIRDLLKNK